MKRLIVAFTFISCFSSMVGGDAAERVFLLSPDSGSQLMKQCSRSHPHGATSFWEPTQEQVNNIEVRLPAFLKSMEARPLSDFNRQYIGFSTEEKHYIYGNFYIQSLGAEHEDRIPVLACDGGDNFWGVVFDIQLKKFSQFESNGSIGPGK